MEKISARFFQKNCQHYARTFRSGLFLSVAHCVFASLYLFQGQLLGDGFIFHLLDLFHQLVHLELLLLLQVLLQLRLLVLQLGWRRSR